MYSIKKRILPLLLAAAFLASSGPYGLPGKAVQTYAAKTAAKKYRLSQSAGTYSKPIKLKLTAKKNFKVYYTLNASDFSSKKIVKSGKSKSFTIKKTTTLYVYAVKASAKVTAKNLKSKAVKKAAKSYLYQIKKSPVIKADKEFTVSHDESLGTDIYTANEAGSYLLSGSLKDTLIKVSYSGTDPVTIYLKDLTLDDKDLTSDEPVMDLGPEANQVKLVLVGENELIGTTGDADALVYQKNKAAAVTIQGDGSLKLTDSRLAANVYSTEGIEVQGNLNINSGSLEIKTGGDGIRSKKGSISLSGGSLDIVSYGDGIQADNEFNMTDGSLTISTKYENAATNFWDTENSVTETETRTQKTKVETVTYDTGSHKGIKAGQKIETEIYADGTSETSESYGGINISGGKLTIDTTSTGVEFAAQPSGQNLENPAFVSGSGMQGSPNAAPSFVSGSGMQGLPNAAPSHDSSTDGQATDSSRPGPQGSDSNGPQNAEGMSMGNMGSSTILGAPDDCIKSNGDMNISGGIFELRSSDHGLNCAGSLTVTGDTAKINISRATEGIQASQILFGTEGGSDSFTIDIYSSDDPINASGKDSIQTVYQDEDETSYIETSVSSLNTHDLTIYGGQITVTVGDDKSWSYSLENADGTKASGTYEADGDGLDANGSIYLYGGTIIVWGPTGSGNDLIDTGDENCQYVIGKNVTLLAAGSAGMGNSPTKIEGPVIGTALSVSKDAQLTVISGSKQLLKEKAPKDLTYLIYASSALADGNSYTIKGGSSDVTAAAASSLTIGGSFGGPQGGGPSQTQSN